MKKKLFLAVAIIIVAALAALMFATPRTTPEEPLPDPNGYDDFVKAASIISSDLSDWNTVPIEKLRELTATNEPVLQLIRTGLGKECRVAPYVLSATNSLHMDDLAKQKRIAYAFCTAHRLALLDGRTNEAVILALDCIRYGNESVRGGVIIDGLVGLAVQAIGLARLEEALPGADADTSKKVVVDLEGIASMREQSADIWKREAQWARRGRFGPVSFVSQVIQPFFQRGMKAKMDQKFIKGATDLQRTKLHAAARAYELDRGQPPTTAHDLVPQYLKSIPLDSTTGQELPLN